MPGRASSRTRHRPATTKKTSTKPPRVGGVPDWVSHYARLVLDGELPAGPHVRDACRRHFRDRKNAGTAAFPYVFDFAEANDRIELFPRRFRLSGGQFEKKRFHLHISQKFIVGSIFGWKHRDTGFRRYRRAYVEEPKGNGKSPLAAGIGMIMFCMDREPGAEVAAFGPTKEQANISFQDAVTIVDNSPALRERVRKWGGNPVWKLSYPKTGSTFRPISKDKKKSGFRFSCGLGDEVHEHDDATVLDMVERGFKWRRNPLLFLITNSGSDPQTVCGREHQHAIEVASGEVDFPETFAYVCALDDGDDWLNDPSVWPKVNPLFGVTVTHDELDREVRQAKAMPGVQNEIARLRFCIWTDAVTAWMKRDTIEACLAEFDPITLHRSKEVSQGLDLSAVTDLAVLANVVETGTMDFIEADPDTGKMRAVKKPTFDAWVDAWTPRDTMTARALVDKRPYDVWERNGYLIATPGEQVRFDFIAARVAYLRTVFRIRALAYDQYAFREFERELQALGVGDIPLWWHPQAGIRRAKPPPEVVELAKQYGEEPPEGLWMPGSLRAVESAMYERRIRIHANPVIKGAMSSARCNRDALGNRWLDKMKATNRIDAAVSICMALGAALIRIAKAPDLSGFLKSPVIVRPSR